MIYGYPFGTSNTWIPNPANVKCGRRLLYDTKQDAAKVHCSLARTTALESFNSQYAFQFTAKRNFFVYAEDDQPELAPDLRDKRKHKILMHTRNSVLFDEIVFKKHSIIVFAFPRLADETRCMPLLVLQSFS